MHPTAQATDAGVPHECSPMGCDLSKIRDSSTPEGNEISHGILNQTCLPSFNLHAHLGLAIDLPLSQFGPPGPESTTATPLFPSQPWAREASMQRPT